MSKAHPSNKVNAPKEKIALTTEVAIQEIRNLRAGKLAVLNVEYIDLFLADYDKRGADLQLTAYHGTARDEAEAQLSEARALYAGTQVELKLAADLLEEHRLAFGNVYKRTLELFPGPLLEQNDSAYARVIRALNALKEADDINAVSTRDLMTTIKRLEGQLLTFGVVVNPNPDLPAFQS